MKKSIIMVAGCISIFAHAQTKSNVVDIVSKHVIESSRLKREKTPVFVTTAVKFLKGKPLTMTTVGSLNATGQVDGMTATDAAIAKMVSRVVNTMCISALDSDSQEDAETALQDAVSAVITASVDASPSSVGAIVYESVAVLSTHIDGDLNSPLNDVVDAIIDAAKSKVSSDQYQFVLDMRAKAEVVIENGTTQAVMPVAIGKSTTGGAGSSSPRVINNTRANNSGSGGRSGNLNGLPARLRKALDYN